MRFKGKVSRVTPDGRFGVVSMDGGPDLGVIGMDTKGRLALMSACGGALAEGARVAGEAEKAGDGFRVTRITEFPSRPHEPVRARRTKGRIRAFLAAALVAVIPVAAHAQDTPVRVIVTLDASLLPDPSSYADSPEGDRQRTADLRVLQETVLRRAFSPDGGPVTLPESYGLTLMDFTPVFAIAAGSYEIGKFREDPAVSGVREDRVAVPFQ